jgi:uncharacterized RDD family membrane protein YckC
MENQYLDSNLDQTIVPLQYGSFLRRFAATLIDGLVFSAIFFLLLAATGGIGKIIAVVDDLKENGGDPNDAAMALASTFLVAILGLTLVQWLYFAYLESSEKQATLGKQAMGLIVTDLDGNRLTFVKASIRHFARILPTLIPFIGSIYTLADYLCQPFTEKKQTLHDMVAGALVLKTK